MNAIKQAPHNDLSVDASILKLLECKLTSVENRMQILELDYRVIRRNLRLARDEKNVSRIIQLENHRQRVVAELDEVDEHHAQLSASIREVHDRMKIVGIRNHLPENRAQ
jgi:seryl-tRNA synthetase